MPFPVSYSGRLTLPTGALPPDALYSALVDRGASDVVQDGAVTRFRVRWFVSAGPLWFIDRGTVAEPVAADGEWSFTLSFRRAAVFAALGCYGWVAGVGMWGEPLLARLAFGTIGFLWLFGFWYVLVPGRFRRFLERTARGETA